MGKGHPVGGNKNKMLLLCDLKISTPNKLNKNKLNSTNCCEA